jgi:tripartite ATP-independent transporter DctM subunit
LSLALVLLFGLFAVLGVPVAFALLGATAAVLGFEGRPLAVLLQRLYSPTQSFPMLAVPFFVLAGHLMMSGALGTHLVDLARLLLGRLRGGLAHTSVLGSVVFGSVSGSAVADASAMGAALIPVQLRTGYPAPFAAAVNAASSTLAVLIPPSIPLILYGLVANVSIVDLFIAGILPGLLGVAMYVGAAAAVAALRPALGPPGERHGLRHRLRALRGVAPTLGLFVVILGGIYVGVFTPTEAAGIGAAVALAIALARRAIGPRDLLDALAKEI